MSSLESTKRSAENTTSPSDQGESKKAAMGDSTPVSTCPGDEKKHPPTRRGIITNMVVENADKVVEHLGKCIGAKEYFRFPDDSGKIMHLALDIGHVAMYLEEVGNKCYEGPEKPHVRLHLNMDDPLAVAEKMIKAGAKTLNKCEKQFWGATFGVFEDPWGVTWSISDSTNTIEDFPKELERTVMPFVSVKNAPGFLDFLGEVFGAEPAMEAAKEPGGKIMCAEMIFNGGNIMVGDHCGEDVDRTDAAITISHEVAPGRAEDVAKAFDNEGGNIVDPPSMQFWGQVWGRCKDKFGQSWGINEPMIGSLKSNADMEVDIRIGEKFKWKWSWSEVDAPQLFCFGEVHTCLAKPSEIKTIMETSLPAAFAEAGKRGLKMVGPPLSGYYKWESKEGGEARLTTGPMVVRGASTEEVAGGETGFGVRSLCGVKSVMVMHVGPYDELIKCYEATFEWISAKGYESKMPAVEMYENNPKDTEPGKLRTKIFVPIVPKVIKDGDGNTE